MIHSKTEIVNELKRNADRFYEWINTQNGEAFEGGPEGKWTTGQHLDHLKKSVEPLNLALLLPKITFKLLFGKPNREGRNYKALVERYETKLSQGGQATGRFVPPVVAVKNKPELLSGFKKQHEKLIKTIGKWKEEQMDVYLLPHPLLGKLTVREMMFFTIYHLEHHLRILDENYEK
jgi:hypothetical protein